MSELLLATPLDAKQRSHVDAIRKAGAHLLRLVNDALDLARIEAGKLELVQQPFDPAQLTQELADFMHPISEARGLRFHYRNQLPAQLVVLGDATRVRQILINLLGNAIKFSERGEVSLTVSRHGEVLRFKVRDSGPGIGPEQQKRLFQRFEQADGARTSARYGGSGLGLAICQEPHRGDEGHDSRAQQAWRRHPVQRGPAVADRPLRRAPRFWRAGRGGR